MYQLALQRRAAGTYAGAKEDIFFLSRASEKPGKEGVELLARFFSPFFCNSLLFVALRATVVELEGFEPSSKQGVSALSTCLFQPGLSGVAKTWTTKRHLSL